MTLAQWCERAQIPFSTIVPERHGIQNDWEFWKKLWTLSDYFVYNQTDGAVRLHPVTEKQQRSQIGNEKS